MAHPTEKPRPSLDSLDSVQLGPVHQEVRPAPSLHYAGSTESLATSGPPGCPFEDIHHPGSPYPASNGIMVSSTTTIEVSSVAYPPVRTVSNPATAWVPPSEWEVDTGEPSAAKMPNPKPKRRCILSRDRCTPFRWALLAEILIPVMLITTMVVCIALIAS